MRLQTKIWLMGLTIAAGFAFAGREAIAAVVIGTTTCVWYLHRIETKVDALLDDRGIVVSEADYDR